MLGAVFTRHCPNALPVSRPVALPIRPKTFGDRASLGTFFDLDYKEVVELNFWFDRSFSLKIETIEDFGFAVFYIFIQVSTDFPPSYRQDLV